MIKTHGTIGHCGPAGSKFPHVLCQNENLYLIGIMGIAGEGGGGVNVWVGRAQGTTK
jgi:hypothetical protein